MTMRAALVAATCVAVGSAGASSIGPDAPAAAIAGEIARIEENRAAFGDQAERFADAVSRAKDGVARGRLLFALEELQEPWTFEHATTWVNAHATIKTSDQFTTEWSRVGEPKLVAGSTRVPAAVEAIAAANAMRAPATWRASRPYSEDAGMNAGLYYLGEAQAFAAFAAFCRSLPFDAHGAAPAFKPMADEITSLEAEAAVLYDKSPAETKPRYIRVSVALKIARSLDERKDYGSALYQFLAAKYRMAVAASPSATGDIKGRLDNARAHLPSGQDHSIAEMFLERAAFLLESSDPSAKTSAAIIADTVLPAYLKLVTR